VPSSQFSSPGSTATQLQLGAHQFGSGSQDERMPGQISAASSGGGNLSAVSFAA